MKQKKTASFTALFIATLRSGKHLYKFVLISSLTATTHCAPDLTERTWIHQNISSFISFQPIKTPLKLTGIQELTDHFIWRGHYTGLTLQKDKINLLRQKLGQGELVMVSYLPETDFGRQLEEASSTWAFHVEQETNNGNALVFVQDGFTLDGLAALAHRDTGCGAIQLLTLVNTLDGASHLIPPVYSEFISLDEVASGKEHVSVSAIEESIKKLEAQGTRHHATDTGQATPSVVESLFKTAAGSLPGFKTEQFSHSNSGATIATSQKSVIATLPGTIDDDTTIIIGAHLDSINIAGTTQNAPGADDDASGIATLTEVLRVIAANGWTFQRRIEFHGYAAEEVGLIGSTHIAQTYRKQGRKVAAMLQVDMNSWSPDPLSSTIHIVDQFTSRTLNRSLKDLLHTYLGGDFVEKALKKGTSDHKSWHQSGYPAVFPFEDPDNYNRAIHTASDNFSNLNNVGLSARFTKLILTFLAHHAGLVQAANFSDAKFEFNSTTAGDLYLAISQGTSEGFYTLSVSAPSNVESVEVCRSNAAGNPGCIEEKNISVRKDDLNNRRIYSLTTELAIEEGGRLAIFGYDSSEKINALRTVRLTVLPL